MAQQTPPTRPTYAEAFFGRAESFGVDLLMLIPELQSVAIVPAWRIPADRLLPGTIAGRNGQLTSFDEMMNLLRGLLRVADDQQARMRAYLQAFDDRAGELAKEINGKTETLRQIEEQIAERQRTLAAYEGLPAAGEPAPSAPGARHQ